jgi:Fe-S oxidoreductase
VDEFTSLYDTKIGLDAVELLERLGFRVGRVNHPESARSFLSKGLLKEAQKIINKNIALFSGLIDEKNSFNWY